MTYGRSEHFISPSETSADYTRYCKPGLGKLLGAFGLDIAYHRASGDHLWYFGPDHREIEVLDLIGSYGATLLGHNPPELVAEMNRILATDPPHLVQASIRSGAAALAKKLNAEAAARLGTDYCAAFFNTGADAVEAAIKHLILIKNSRGERLLEQVLIQASQILSRHAMVPRRLDTRAFPDFPTVDFRDEQIFLETLDQFNRSHYPRRFRLLALENAYHGQSLGALSMTFNRRYREPFAEALLPVVFLPPDPDTFASHLRSPAGSIARLVCEGDQFRLLSEPVSDLLGLFLEPILGEGGVLPLSGEALTSIMKTATQERVPVVADEVQTGMGRTGTLFCWEQSGAPAPDLLLLSKFLGGGLVKLSAVLSRREITEEEFGIVHASTFAEDEISCRIGLKTLELLLRDESALLKRVNKAGAQWEQKLLALRDEFPDIIKAVRGKGLLWGLEFHDLRDSGSNLLRFICTQGDFGYFVAGFLLHEYSIRIAPALNSKNTVRFEPSVNFSEAGMDHVQRAFRNLCHLLRLRDTGRLSRFLLPDITQADLSETVDFRREPGELVQPEPRNPHRVAFLGHFINPSFLGRHEPALGRLSTAQLERIIDRTWEFMDPCLFVSRDITSKTGQQVNFNFIGISVTSQILLEHLRHHRLGTVRDLIRKAVLVARDQNCRLVGFGQFTSIVTRNCLEIVIPPVGFTSGNSLTVGMALKALQETMARRSISFDRQTVAVLGAGGNIGSTFARLLADQAGGLVLIGGLSNDSHTRLEKTFGIILADQVLLLERAQPIGPIGKWIDQILDPEERRRFIHNPALRETGLLGKALFERVRSELTDQCPIRFSRLENSLNCQVLVTATNTTLPIVFAPHIRPGTLVCDISVPSALAPEVARIPDVEVFKGGVVGLPNRERLNIGALPLEAGLVYSCMAETILLGLERRWQNYSVGDISKEQVLNVLALAEKHGFALARVKVEDSL
ncbi:MAG: aminotransferase class III-fold pyridoxal phosphate-dependent enzyme [Candidatus Ozemobacteraceae bacterium]